MWRQTREPCPVFGRSRQIQSRVLVLQMACVSRYTTETGRRGCSGRNGPCAKPRRWPLKHFTAVLFLMAGSLQGAVITSGTLDFSQHFRSPELSATLTLNDGITASTSSVADGPISGTCYDRGAGCQFSGLPALGLGASASYADGYIVYLNFSYASSFTAIRGVTSQSFQNRFTASGDVAAYYPSRPTTPCPFPDAVAPTCAVPVTGSGTATVTVTRVPIDASFGAFDAFYISDTTYSFTSAPEPSTAWLLALPVFWLLCRIALKFPQE